MTRLRVSVSPPGTASICQRPGSRAIADFPAPVLDWVHPVILDPKRRQRLGLCVLAALLGLLVALHAQRSGELLISSRKASRCRACGALERERHFVILGATLHDGSRFSETRLSRILNPPGARACVHGAKHPVCLRSFRWTTETFPGAKFVRVDYDDVAGLADNDSFLGVMSTVGRTNLEEARAVWMALSRIDYRSSNQIARFYPSLTRTNVAEVIAFIHSEPVLASERR